MYTVRKNPPRSPQKANSFFLEFTTRQRDIINFLDFDRCVQCFLLLGYIPEGAALATGQV